MRASKNGLSLTIIFAMILSNVIDIKESQACPGAIGVGIGAWGSTGRSLQSLGISLSIKIFLDNIQFHHKYTFI